MSQFIAFLATFIKINSSIRTSCLAFSPLFPLLRFHFNFHRSQSESIRSCPFNVSNLVRPEVRHHKSVQFSNQNHLSVLHEYFRLVRISGTRLLWTSFIPIIEFYLCVGLVLCFLTTSTHRHRSTQLISFEMISFCCTASATCECRVIGRAIKPHRIDFENVFICCPDVYSLSFLCRRT